MEADNKTPPREQNEEPCGDSSDFAPLGNQAGDQADDQPDDQPDDQLGDDHFEDELDDGQLNNNRVENQPDMQHLANGIVFIQEQSDEHGQRLCRNVFKLPLKHRNAIRWHVHADNGFWFACAGMMALPCTPLDPRDQWELVDLHHAPHQAGLNALSCLLDRFISLAESRALDILWVKPPDSAKQTVEAFGFQLHPCGYHYLLPQCDDPFVINLKAASCGYPAMVTPSLESTNPDDAKFARD